MIDRVVRIATRGSKLAIYQTQKVKEELEKHFPDRIFEIVRISTKGDMNLEISLSKVEDLGFFTRELENSLLRNETDIAVHSLKDMPTALPQGLTLYGVLERGEVREALVSVKGKKLSELDENDIVATSSLRRKAQLLKINGKLRIVDIRGNVDTRIRKMDNGLCTAMVMACAGLQRLGLDDRITEVIDPFLMFPAVSQGAIAIEVRENDFELESMIKEINHIPTFTAVMAERAFLRALDGGCQIPIGCYSQILNGKFEITGFVSNMMDSVLKASAEGEFADAEKTAVSLAQNFIKRGAQEMIRKIRKLNNV